MTKNRTSKITLGGICLALTVIFMFAGSVVPGIELTLYAISSVFVAVMILEAGVSGGVILYAASLLLGFILIPNKPAILPYAFLFGYYGIVKYYIEKLSNGVVQIMIKTAFFAAALSIALLGFRNLLLGSIELPDYPVIVLIIGGVLMMILYDYIYTLLINFYIKRIRRKGVDNMKLS